MLVLREGVPQVTIRYRVDIKTGRWWDTKWHGFENQADAATSVYTYFDTPAPVFRIVKVTTIEEWID